MQTVVIVGGGISGLTLAYRLQQEAPAVQVTLLERENRLGTERRDGFAVELAANGFLDSKSSTLTLSHDLGLDDRLVPASEENVAAEFLRPRRHGQRDEAGSGGRDPSLASIFVARATR
jgi:protoporphyrinogen/coproporphyrinogen III oxidase